MKTPDRRSEAVSEQVQKQFQPRFWSPSEQDVDEAMWCVETNEPWTCAHDPECRDVMYAEIKRLREEQSKFEEKFSLWKIKEDCYEQALLRLSAVVPTKDGGKA